MGNRAAQQALRQEAAAEGQQNMSIRFRSAECGRTGALDAGRSALDERRHPSETKHA